MNTGVFGDRAGGRGLPAGTTRPLLLVDIDGVISLFGVPAEGAGHTLGRLHSIDGTLHFLSAAAAAHLLELASLYELVWASGWEDRADEHLPHLLGLPAGLAHISFATLERPAGAHWKLEGVESFAAGRALAWVDDAFNEACHEWAARRSAPTLLVATDPRLGLTAREADVLADWARRGAATAPQGAQDTGVKGAWIAPDTAAP